MNYWHYVEKVISNLAGQVNMSELMKEMQEYIDRYPVTEDERLALLEWVQSGHSVYERCPSRYLPESEEQDFLDIYRQDREIDYDVAGMSCDEMIAYLKDYMGYIEPEPVKSYSYGQLEEMVRRLEKENLILYHFLERKGIEADAKQYVRQHIDEEIPFYSV